MGLEELSRFSALPLPLILSVDNRLRTETLAIRPAYLITDNEFDATIPVLARVQSLEDLKTLITSKSITGIVLKGGAELKPGLKDFEVMNDVLEFLEEE
jgi:phosphoribosylanthranilate isomerase